MSQEAREEFKVQLQKRLESIQRQNQEALSAFDKVIAEHLGEKFTSPSGKPPGDK
jgi:hypothetical protein